MVKKTKKNSKLLRILAFIGCLIFLFGVFITPCLAYNYGHNDLNENYQASACIGVRSLTFSTDSWVYTTSLDSQYLLNIISFGQSQVVYIAFYTNNGTSITLPVYFDVNLNSSGDNPNNGTRPYIYMRFDTSSLLDDEECSATVVLDPFISTEYNVVQSYHVPRFIVFEAGTAISSYSYDVKYDYFKLGVDMDNNTYYTDADGSYIVNSSSVLNSVFDVTTNIDDNIGTSDEYFCTEVVCTVPLPSNRPSFQIEIPLTLTGGNVAFDPSSYNSFSDFTRFADFATELPKPDEVLVVEKLPDTILEFIDGFSAIFDIRLFGSVTLGAILIIPLSVLIVLSIMRKFAGG